MKKRYLPILLACVMACGVFTGCSKKETNAPAQEEGSYNRDIYFKDLGLAYTIPDLWVDYMETNIYMEALGSENVFAKIVYSYVTDEGMEAIKSAGPLDDISKYLYPLATIAVIHKDKVDSDTAQAMFREFETKDYVSYSGDYEYYLLSGTKSDISALTENEKTLFEYLRAGVPSLKNSVVTSVFDPNALSEQSDKLNRTITFVTKTLEGKDIDSTVFADYDVTLLNFTGTYAFSGYNESETMQALWETLQKKYPNVNLIQAVVDTPDEANEALAKEAKAAVNGTYTSIMLDELLSNWVTNNLQGVPSSLLIDHNGDIIGDSLLGKKTEAEYLAAIEDALKAIQNNAE